jgi:15-cis-phytoene synthase
MSTNHREQPRQSARASIEKHSKSFALASRLLPSKVNHDAVVLYAYCRRADDAIDLCPPAQQLAQLARLRAELNAVYAGEPQRDPLLAAFQTVLRECAVPRSYLDELLLGMEMDAQRVQYHSMTDLTRYAYRVAGTVGLMMCHVMGVRDSAGLRHAAHLGIAMQLTNIARDVHEDWDRGRLYLPRELLVQCGAPALDPTLGQALPPSAAAGLARATEALLVSAEQYYRSGDAGMRYLAPRCALAIRAARLVYSAIAVRLRAQHCDPFAPRAVVSHARKLRLVAYAAWLTLLQLPQAVLRPRPRIPAQSVTDPNSVLHVTSS